jgi:hypothetical protein
MSIRLWRARSILGRLAGAALACGLAIGVASAAGSEDRPATEALLRDVEASPKKSVAAEMIARSRTALERASKLRAEGDERHARLAEGLARTWAEAARDVVRAVDVEEKAQAARRAATDAGVIAERERALLEEGIAQSGRVRAQLESVEREAKEQPARTSSAANADTDGGAKRKAAGAEPAPKAPPAPAREEGAP